MEDLESILLEREELKKENIKLWSIIEKQKIIIAQLKINNNIINQNDIGLFKLPTEKDTKKLFESTVSLSIETDTNINDDDDKKQIIFNNLSQSSIEQSDISKSQSDVSQNHQSLPKPIIGINKKQSITIEPVKSPILDIPSPPVSPTGIMHQKTPSNPNILLNVNNGSLLSPNNGSTGSIVPSPVGDFPVLEENTSSPNQLNPFTTPPQSNGNHSEQQNDNAHQVQSPSHLSKPSPQKQPEMQNNLLTSRNFESQIVKSFLRKSNNGSAFLTFVFKLSVSGQIVHHIEKGRADCLALDQALKKAFTNLPAVQQIVLPDPSFFVPNPSGKQSTTPLQTWMQNILQTCVDHPTLLTFLSSDIVPGPPQKESFKKSGVLLKKGNYFGGWKTRFFSLDVSSGTVYYSDSKQGEVLGSFALQCAYVANLIPNKKDGDSEKPGFVVLEYKRTFFASNDLPDSLNADGLPAGKVDFRHVFYAESTKERDSWIRCLLGTIIKLRPTDLVARELFSRTVPPQTSEPEPLKTQSLHIGKPTSSSGPILTPPPQNMRATMPIGPNPGNSFDVTQLPSLDQFSKSPANEDKPISLIPQNNVVEKRASFENRDRLAAPERISGGMASRPRPNEGGGNRESTMFSRTPPGRNSGSSPQSNRISTMAQRPSSGKQGGRYVDDQTRCLQQALPPLMTVELPLNNTKVDPKKKGSKTFKDWMKKPETRNGNRPVFGVSLQEAIANSKIKEDIELPSIVYRCIEYLDGKKAYEEEGLYRLSGASSVITNLKALFDENGDVPLLETDVYYDPHAIAGLLKLFFRELNEPLFTQELRMEFFKVTDIPDRAGKIRHVTQLIAQLPPCNYACLKVLSGHLLRVVQKSQMNKMTVRNVSIVFSPTLGIPAGLFTLLLAEYSTIFCWDYHDHSRGLESSTPVEIESPSVLTTPTLSGALSGSSEASTPAPITATSLKLSSADEFQDLMPNITYETTVEAIQNASKIAKSPSNGVQNQRRPSNGDGTSPSGVMRRPSNGDNASPNTSTLPPQDQRLSTTNNHLNQTPTSRGPSATDIKPEPLSVVHEIVTNNATKERESQLPTLDFETE
ncbi:hypothetical protein BC833DRAFT_604899 [Globomyces pollinis-pini]|nr:hypothetical protein BC833DRAFT_604899 [Globomyces pollinis-pini]